MTGTSEEVNSTAIYHWFGRRQRRWMPRDSVPT